MHLIAYYWLWQIITTHAIRREPIIFSCSPKVWDNNSPLLSTNGCLLQEFFIFLFVTVEYINVYFSMNTLYTAVRTQLPKS